MSKTLDQTTDKVAQSLPLTWSKKYPIRTRVTHLLFTKFPAGPTALTSPATHRVEHMFDSWARGVNIQAKGRQQRNLSHRRAHRAAAHHPERHPRLGDQPRLPAEHPRN